MPRYEVIDHQADIGIRVAGVSPEELFTHAAEAMFDLMVRPKRAYLPSIRVSIDCEGEGFAELLKKWLSELLFLYENRRLVLSLFWIDELTERRVRGGAKGLKFDAARHEAKTTIKAVTYHQLKVLRLEDGRYKGQVIFDV